MPIAVRNVDTGDRIAGSQSTAASYTTDARFAIATGALAGTGTVHRVTARLWSATYEISTVGATYNMVARSSIACDRDNSS